MMRRLLLLVPLILLSGCVESVQPWEKATLAKETMKEGGINKLTKKFEEHTYYSKEATKGGGTIGGGGCGCN
jgi:hypothetical protein